MAKKKKVEAKKPAKKKKRMEAMAVVATMPGMTMQGPPAMRYQAFVRLCASHLGIKASRKIVELRRELARHQEDCDELRKKLIETYGKKNGKGEFEVPEKGPRHEAFQKEYEELANTEVEMKTPKIYVLTRDAERHEDGTKLTGDDLWVLEDYFEIVDKLPEKKKK